MPTPEPPRAPDPDSRRMTIGEHLDELRGCLVRSLVALLVACVLCIWPARYLLEWLARPVVLALRRHGQPDSFLATSPVENILVYIKVVLVFGLVLAGPYILYQIWRFVGAGLYPHEKRWALRLVPASIGLFAAGVAFMYAFALVLSLNFLVGFSGWLPLPTATPNAFERAVLHLPPEKVPATQPAIGQAPILPLLPADPADPPVGAVWVNLPEGKLKVRGVDETHSLHLLRDDRRSLVTTHFRIGEYLSFVLILTIAFGLAFQMPLVVLFLTWSGIVRVETLRRYRKVVILLIVIAAGILAPPDLFSHLLLAGPMLLLFELGILLARRFPRRAPAPAGPRS